MACLVCKLFRWWRSSSLRVSTGRLPLSSQFKTKGNSLLYVTLNKCFNNLLSCCLASVNTISIWVDVILVGRSCLDGISGPTFLWIEGTSSSSPSLKCWVGETDGAIVQAVMRANPRYRKHRHLWSVCTTCCQALKLRKKKRLLCCFRLWYIHIQHS